jgi:NitT/TauT family transport system substrate-binding protein
MVPASSSIRTLADLKGRKLAVAGGPIDKKLAAAAGVDEAGRHRPEVGRDDRLRRATAAGGEDAQRRNGCHVNYWNFCAALEAKGFRRLAGIEDLLPKLGAKGRTAMIGYVFDENGRAQTRTRLPASSP